MVDLQKKVAGLTGASVERFVARARRAAGVRGSVNVLVTDRARMRSFNRRFRAKDRPTDVLSFPSRTANAKSRRAVAGDIAICAEIASENAARFGHAPTEEVKILILHGMLHLAGLDHERDNGTMARKEARLRRILKLPSTLIERVQSGRVYSATKKKSKGRRAGAVVS